jgi:HSP20 family protein
MEKKMNLLKREYIPLTELNQFFDKLLKSQLDSSFVDTGTWAPAVDIKEEPNRFLVTADIPGVEKNDIHISLENSLLTIHGERKISKSEDKDGYSRIERVQGQFYRRFNLPQSVDESKIDASYKSGVLKISIPKKEPHKGKKIEIKMEE